MHILIPSAKLVQIPSNLINIIYTANTIPLKIYKYNNYCRLKITKCAAKKTKQSRLVGTPFPMLTPSLGQPQL